LKIGILAFFSIFAIQSHAEDISLCQEGWGLTQSGNHKEAIELFDKCLTTGSLSDSSLARTYRNIGIAKKRDGQLEGAIESYSIALSLNPSDPWDDYVNRGNAWSELGEYKKAFANYEKALELKPNYNEVFYNRGIVFEKQGLYKRAIEEFKKSYEYGLRSPELYDRFIAHRLIE
jgi:tetratricopeptide (TPR) repeat protein